MSVQRAESTGQALEFVAQGGEGPSVAFALSTSLGTWSKWWRPQNRGKGWSARGLSPDRWW